MITDEVIAEGLSLVQGDLQHDLKVGFRCRLRCSLDEPVGETGRRRRTKLATLAVERVLPLWESLLPADHTPHQALQLAEKLLVGTITSVAAESEMGKLWAHCDDLSWRYADKQSVIMVGYSAIQAVREAISEKHFGCERVNDGSTDMDVEPYDHDSAFCALIAYSGGPPWDKSSDAEKRLEFWTWWLTSAVRTAMIVV